MEIILFGFIGLLLLALGLHTLYLKKNHIRLYIRLKRLENRFNNGTSEPFDKGEWERNILMLKGEPGAVKHCYHFTLVYQDFMKKYYPSIEPRHRTTEQFEHDLNEIN